MDNRVPNQGLERLYRETGWTLRQFAQAVNRVGTERGTPTAQPTDRSRVAQGACPE